MSRVGDGLRALVAALKDEIAALDRHDLDGLADSMSAKSRALDQLAELQVTVRGADQSALLAEAVRLNDAVARRVTLLSARVTARQTVLAGQVELHA